MSPTYQIRLRSTHKLDVVRTRARTGARFLCRRRGFRALVFPHCCGKTLLFVVCAGVGKLAVQRGFEVALLDAARAKFRRLGLFNGCLFFLFLPLLKGDDLAAFERFMSKLGVLCDEKGAGTEFLPPVSTFVAVKLKESASTGQEQWRRAMVTRHLSDRFVTVQVHCSFAIFWLEKDFCGHM